VGTVASASAEQARGAVEAAHGAWKGWSALEPERRAERLLSALKPLEDGRDSEVDLLVRENGKVRFEAQIELGSFPARCRLAAGLVDELRQTRRLPRGDRPGLPRQKGKPAFRSEVSNLSLGVVSIVLPYNWPLAILGASLPYALIAGNTVVVKPPPTAPLCVSRALQAFAAGLPAGVVNVVSGTNDAVAPVLADPRVQKIVFTGSTSAGKTMMRLASSNLTRVTLELGGNDPALVLEDANLDSAALQRLTLACFLTAGQVCMGVKRIYVQRSRYDEVVSGMSEILAGYRVGPGLDATSVMGPLNNARQRDFVSSLCAEARANGHEVRELGVLDEAAAHGGGYFLRPRLVLDPAPNLGIVTEEQFGPAVPILPFDDVDAVVEQLNGEWSGLCSSVWSADLERAAAIAGRLRTGTTWINDANAMALDDRAPFGGFRQSGIGRELGREGLLDFTEAHTVTFPE